MGAKGREWFCPWCGVKGYHGEGNIPVGGEISPQENN